MSFYWEPIFQEMACLSFASSLSDLLTTAYLNRICIISVFFKFDLRDLASIKLDDCAWHKASPLVPNLRHTNFVAYSTNPLTFSNYRLCVLNFELRIDFVVDLPVRVQLLLYSNFRRYNRCVV